MNVSLIFTPGASDTLPSPQRIPARTDLLSLVLVCQYRTKKKNGNLRVLLYDKNGGVFMEERGRRNQEVALRATLMIHSELRYKR